MGVMDRKPIPGFPGHFADTNGRIWLVRDGEAARVVTKKNRRGYETVTISDGTRMRWLPVHRLVLEAFVGPRPPGKEACHYPDPDKTNNCLSNLRWDTHAENMRDRYRDLPAPATKVCTKCHTEKSASEFYTANTWDGLRAACKKCHCRTTIETRDRERGLACWRARYHRRKAPQRAELERAFARFFAECCSFELGGTAVRAEVLTVYRQWCKANDRKPAHPRELAKRLREMGASDSGRRTWSGVHLIATDNRKTIPIQGRNQEARAL